MSPYLALEEEEDSGLDEVCVGALSSSPLGGALLLWLPLAEESEGEANTKSVGPILSNKYTHVFLNGSKRSVRKINSHYEYNYRVVAVARSLFQQRQLVEEHNLAPASDFSGPNCKGRQKRGFIVQLKHPIRSSCPNLLLPLS